jgi:hypothetical protein
MDDEALDPTLGQHLPSLTWAQSSFATSSSSSFAWVWLKFVTEDFSALYDPVMPCQAG